MPPIANKAVSDVYAGCPEHIRKKLLEVRSLIFETAAGLSAVGELEETLKWGEPSYLTSQTRSGTTIRLGWKESRPAEYAMFFNCQTDLVERFRQLFSDDFEFEGNRAIWLRESTAIPTEALKYCIGAALMYHHDKRVRRKRRT